MPAPCKFLVKASFVSMKQGTTDGPPHTLRLSPCSGRTSRLGEMEKEQRPLAGIESAT